MPQRHSQILTLLSVWVVLASPAFLEAADPGFNEEVRPILAAKCFECHGPDEGSRKAKLRLDQAGADALTNGELLARITSTDPDEVMPPPDSNKSLEPDQVQTLKAWIASGAGYEIHWAFVPPTQPDTPKVTDAAWPQNPIDHFIATRLETEGLTPSPEADLYVLVRRVYLDLIGLPPTPEEADQFVDSFIRRPDTAYEVLVDRLLDSPHYGERWARRWLDLARYADTNGYEKDRPRSIWPWRDWVINALNQDMPFDRFTIEQLAGDMLPGATVDQRIATGFHRNTMINEEGGIDPLEYRFHAMVDRVATTGTVWMGLTTGCAQCHTHKYDPITHTDYYALMALLNNADEPGLFIHDPVTEEKRFFIDRKIRRIEDQLITRIVDPKFKQWLLQERAAAVRWEALPARSATSNLPKLNLEPNGVIFAHGDFTKRDVYQLEFQLDGSGDPVTALRLEALPDPRLPAGGPGRAYYEGREGDFFLSEIKATAEGKPVAFHQPSHDFGKIAVGSGNAKAGNVIDGKGSTGWSTATRENERHELVLNLVTPIPTPATLEVELLFERHFVAGLGKFRISVSREDKIAKARPGSAVDLFTGGWEDLRRDYIRYAPEFAERQAELVKIRSQLPLPASTMVLEERPPDNPRPTYRHHRGEYLQPKEAVSPAVPAIFPQLPGDSPADRLALAQWLVSESNPLVARVVVNRAWQAIFGTGIVRTTADFGTQSEPPSHPPLLDWLACEFMEQGWSLKQLHRLIVTSATYRQASESSPTLRQRDPDNRLLARGPRFRVEAEMIRDIALRSSGLLSTKMRGASVFPPQPASVTGLAYGNTKWNVSPGEDRYRRSLYTFAKRTAPFAAYTVFDAPTGEVCITRRERSNTPLQALTLLNDPMYLETARAMATDLAEEPYDAAYELFRRALTRPPTDEETADLITFYEAQRARGQSPADAWMLVARILLNLDETITKS